MLPKFHSLLRHVLVDLSVFLFTSVLPSFFRSATFLSLRTHCRSTNSTGTFCLGFLLQSGRRSRDPRRRRKAALNPTLSSMNESIKKRAERQTKRKRSVNPTDVSIHRGIFSCLCFIIALQYCDYNDLTRTNAKRLEI